LKEKITYFLVLRANNSKGGKMDEERWSFLKKAMLFFTISNLLICVAYIVVSIILINSNQCTTNESLQSVFIGGNQVFIENKKIFYDLSTKDFSFISFDGNKEKKILSGHIGMSLELNDYKKISTIKNPESFTISYEPKSRAANISLEVATSKKNSNDGINCKSIKWTVRNNYGERFANQEFDDCFSLGDYSWFGGAEAFEQLWPINDKDYLIHLPYVTGLYGYFPFFN
jgi:hypothetical protein